MWSGSTAARRQPGSGDHPGASPAGAGPHADPRQTVLAARTGTGLFARPANELPGQGLPRILGPCSFETTRLQGVSHVELVFVLASAHAAILLKQTALTFLVPNGDV